MKQGFTLIELLITLFMIGIMLAIAYPTYNEYLIKIRRVDALHTISQYQQILERCYSIHFSYSAACNALPVFPHASLQGYYTINLSNLGTSTYTLTAIPVGVQAQDNTCAIISVNQANLKTSSNLSNPSLCWNN